MTEFDSGLDDDAFRNIDLPEIDPHHEKVQEDQSTEVSVCGGEHLPWPLVRGTGITIVVGVVARVARGRMFFSEVFLLPKPCYWSPGKKTRAASQSNRS